MYFQKADLFHLRTHVCLYIVLFCVIHFHCRCIVRMLCILNSKAGSLVCAKSKKVINGKQIATVRRFLQLDGTFSFRETKAQKKKTSLRNLYWNTQPLQQNYFLLLIYTLTDAHLSQTRCCNSNVTVCEEKNYTAILY